MECAIIHVQASDFIFLIRAAMTLFHALLGIVGDVDDFIQLIAFFLPGSKSVWT